MPVYAYTCRDCGTPLEVHQEFSDATLTECPVCGGRLRKQYGTIGVTFNGSGFYRTDSRSGSGEGGSTSDASKSDAGKSDGGAKKGADAGSAPKSGDAKPAAASSSSTPSASSAS